MSRRKKVRQRPSGRAPSSARKRVHERDQDVCAIGRAADLVRYLGITAPPLGWLQNWHCDAEAEVHHWSFWGNGGPPEANERHHSSNMIVLCSSCHDRLHEMYQRLHGYTLCDYSPEVEAQVVQFLELLDFIMILSIEINEDWLERLKIS